MKSLKNCIRLSCSIRIYVPSTVEVDKPIDNDLFVNKTLQILSNEFGGATASKAIGAWVSGAGQLVKEDVTIVFAYANSDQLERSGQKIYDYCLELKSTLKQEAIALEINGEMYLI